MITLESYPTAVLTLIIVLLLFNILLVRSGPRRPPSQRKGKGH